MTAVADRTEALLDIPVGLLRAHPGNIRRDATPDKTLLESIKQVGILEPLLVRPASAGGEWELLAGHRRLAAAIELGLATVPAMARPADESQVVEIMLVENLARKDLSPLEEAAGIDQLTKLGRSQRQVAALLGVSQSHISKRLSLLKLSGSAREAVETGQITVEDGINLARFDTAAVAKLFKNGVPSRHDLDSAVRKHEREIETAEKIADLRKAGVEILSDAPAWNADDRTGPVRVASLRHINADEHIGQSCRAVFVDHYGYLTECCTCPSAHPIPANSKTADDSDRRQVLDGKIQTWVPDEGWVDDDELTDTQRSKIAEALAEQAQRHVDRDRRTAWISEHIAKPPISQRYPEVFGLAAMVLPLISDMDMRGVIGHLGIELVDDEDVWEAGPGIVQDWARSGPHAPLQVLLAIILEVGEDHFRGVSRRASFGETDHDILSAAKAYIAYLRDHGYEMSDLEAAVLADENPPTVEIKPAGKKWKVVCSAHGEIARQTTEEYAATARSKHLWEIHGVGEAAAS